MTWTQRAYLSFARQGDHGRPPYTPTQLEAMAFDPDEITELVGLAPTTSWRRGDPSPFRPGPTTRNFAAWKYELPPQSTPHSEAVVIALLDAVEPFADGIRQACRTLDLRVDVRMVVEAHGTAGASIAYSARTIQRLATLGAGIDHDQYHYSS